MKAAFLTFLQKVFDIRQGEYKRALLMQLNFFLVIATLLIVKPTVNGLFLAQLGASKLPLAYLLVAVFAILVSTIYAKILGRVNLNRIILGTLIVSAALFILFGVLLRHRIVSGWILYAFYIVMSIFAVLSVSQFWVLANVIFNVRQSKRIFGFIGAGAIGGGIVGGYITTVLAGPIGSENLIFVAAGILFLCIPNTYYIWQKFVISSQSKFQRRKKIPKLEHPFFLIRKSKHLTNLSAIIALSVVVARLVDYQFGAITSSIIRDPDRLTAFFGFWFSNFNVLSLVIQLILTRRIVNKIGIGGSLFLLPASIFIGAALVLIVPALWTAVILKSSDASLKQSLNRATFELLAVPVPNEIKNQAKIFMDVVIDSLATGAGGLILIFIVNSLELSTGFISLIILVLLGLWFYFGKRVRITYIAAFRHNLKNLPKEEVLAINLENENLVAELKQIMLNGSDEHILSVLRQLRIQPDKRFLEDLKSQLNHHSYHIQEQAIRNLYLIENDDASKLVKPLLQSDSTDVRIAAFSYLISRAGKSAPGFIRRYLEVNDYKVTLPLLVSLAEEGQEDPSINRQFKLTDRLVAGFNSLGEKSGLERRFFAIHLLEAAGYCRSPILYPQIEKFFTDSDIEVQSKAIESAGVSMDPYFIPALIELLGEKHSAKFAIKALVHYGNEIIPAIIRYMKPAHVGIDIIRNLPLVVAKFPIQMAVDFLFVLAQENDSHTRLKALQSLVALKHERPTLNFYRKKCQKFFHTECRNFSDLVHSEIIIKKEAQDLFLDSGKSESVAKNELDEFFERQKRYSYEQAKDWLYLMSAPVKITLESITGKVLLEESNDSVIDLEKVPDSQEKLLLLNLAKFGFRPVAEKTDFSLIVKSKIFDLYTALNFLASHPGMDDPYRPKIIKAISTKIAG